MHSYLALGTKNQYLKSFILPINSNRASFSNLYTVTSKDDYEFIKRNTYSRSQKLKSDLTGLLRILI